LRLRKQCYGVAEVTSFVIILAIEAVVISAALFGMSTVLESRTNRLGELQAQNVANSIADGIVDAVYTYNLYPNMTFYKIVELPKQISWQNYRGFNIEINNKTVFVNSSDYKISANSTNFGIENLDILVYGSINVINRERVAIEYSDDEISIKYV
jgi:MFS superfamily sulfate permease-like transporter